MGIILDALFEKAKEGALRTRRLDTKAFRNWLRRGLGIKQQKEG